MTFTRYDPVMDSMVECGSRQVTCFTPGCENEGIPIEVADDPYSAAQCGPCGQWIIAPNGGG